MDILKTIESYAWSAPDQAAIISDGDVLTYRNLDTYSTALAHWIASNCENHKVPIIVYGHKEALMLVCFLACVKAGHAYCPIDISVPAQRVQKIAETVNPPLILCPGTNPGSTPEEIFQTVSPVILNQDKIQSIITGKSDVNTASSSMEAFYDHKDKELFPVTGNDTFYIIFTSGSTGTPKGVQISAECLSNFLDWSAGLGYPSQEKTGAVFLNQAPFSFDLSVMDLYTCLACGGTLWTLNKETQSDYKWLLDSLRKSHAQIWVSTPSFADMCLADPYFCGELMPDLRLFLFCGETLTNHTARQLLERFPKGRIINTYGPTESTVALTEVTITKELLDNEPVLPVGRVKLGSLIEIWDEQGHPVPEGTNGEIVLLGNTISTGYYQLPEQTQKSFFQCERDGQTIRGYLTGDCGYLKGGMLYYQGRIDLQIKLHGYRIELEDIEQNIQKLADVKNVVVTPNIQEGKVKSLTAHLVYEGLIENRLKTAKKLKEEMKQFLPDYMIPKKIHFLEQIPMTVNGKADRKRLGGETT